MYTIYVVFLIIVKPTAQITRPNNNPGWDVYFMYYYNINHPNILRREMYTITKNKQMSIGSSARERKHSTGSG